MGKVGETRGGVRKSGVLEHKKVTIKAAICLKRVKIDEKLNGGPIYRNSPTLFRTVPSPTFYGLPFQKIATSTQNCNRYYLRKEGVKIRTANLAEFLRVYLNRSP